MAAPIANAGSDVSNIKPGTVVTLDGSGSSDPDGAIVSYAWTQTAGPSVGVPRTTSPYLTTSSTLTTSSGSLEGSGATRTFVAPLTLAGTTLTFQLMVTDNNDETSTDSVTCTVLPATERVVVNGAWSPARLKAM